MVGWQLPPMQKVEQQSLGCMQGWPVGTHTPPSVPPSPPSHTPRPPSVTEQTSPAGQLLLPLVTLQPGVQNPAGGTP